MVEMKIEMVNSIWVRFISERQKFGIKTTTYFGEENIYYADDVDFKFIFPARPRPGISTMNISTQGITMKVSQPFVISGDIKVDNDGKETLTFRLHHQK
ncbi:MAG: hypothetical protein GY870_12790 [archaeon]|nr:hypothetical protein [archaeon]